jgi:hypothetical protein
MNVIYLFQVLLDICSVVILKALVEMLAQSEDCLLAM